MANTEQGLRGLTFESAIAPNPGLANRLNDLRETGDPRFGRYEDEPAKRFRQRMREIDEEGELLNQMLNWTPSRNERMQSQYQGYLETNPSEDIGLEAASVGFGESRFDRRFTSPSQLNDIEDARARQQSTLGVYGNSIAKMGILAATTAADSWVGLPAGIINLAVESSSGNIHSGRDFLNALVSNPVSAYLQGINEKSEEIFRNNQTSEERNRPWWENMFTANFIGDTLIKNAGFTIGAVVGAKASVNVLGKLTGAKEARDAFKGLAAELGLEGKSASEVVEILAKGSTSLEKEAAVKALAESAKQLKNYELGLQIAGGLLAGTGEARIEALNGVSEFEKSLEDMYGDLDMERAKAIRRIQRTMDKNGLDINTPEGKAYYDEQKALVDENYYDLKEQIAHDKAMVANTIFALNVPLLTAGDMIQWGKAMLGGYAIDRNLVKGIKKVTENAALKGAAKTPEELIKATRYASKGTKFTDFLGKVGAGSRNVLVEMQEEMNQSFFSATAKAKAMGDTTEFMERLYDPIAVADTVSWLDAAKEGMRQSWLNKDDWVEGFAGGFMGFLGLPSISVKVNENGKRTPKLTMEGGIWSPIREQNDMYDRRNKLVENLNNKLSSPSFLNYYYGKIGNAHFDSIKESAVKQGDQNLYKKADHAQLVNDAMMFERAGRLQDFIDIIDSFSTVSDDTIEQIKKLFPASDDVQKMTTSGMRNLINKNVEKMKRQLDDYIKVADDIKTVYGNMLPDAQIAEMTWQTTHLNEIEHDLKDILAHPETSAMLSAYRTSHADQTKDLTDYDIIGSPAYFTWLKNKYKDKKDTTNKSELEVALKDAGDGIYDMKERGKYIDNISMLSNDPELIQKRMTRIRRQQEELRRISQAVKAVQTLSTTEKLSEFVNAMDELGDVPNETLADIKREADRGNKVADEYLKVRDIDKALEKHVREIAEKSGATEEDIKQALAAWKYFMHNSDTAFDLTSKHSAKDIAPGIAGEKAVALMDEAVEAAAKKLKTYGKFKQRTISKKKPGQQEEPGEGNTKFKTTGNTLTQKKFEEICNDLKKNARMGHDVLGGANILKVNLDKADVYFDGVPATGIIYLYYPGAVMQKGGREYMLPVAYDMKGNEIDPEDVAKLQNEEGLGLTEWLNGNNVPAGGWTPLNVNFPQKIAQFLPIGNKTKPSKPKPETKKKEGKDAGKKTNPHKFIAPNMDMAMLGSDGQAVAEVLKSLPEDSELHFGMENEDGPVYILAGDSNIKIGTLPEEVEGGETYSGLAELKELIKTEYLETGSKKNADGMWISEKYVNHLREKQDSGFVTTESNVPIDEIPGFDGLKEPVIMFVNDEKGGQEYYFSNNSVDISQVQFRMGASNQIKPGFAYLLVPSGKNKFIPVMLYTQNVNNDTLDLNNPEVIASGFGKRVSDAIDKIVAAVTNSNEKEKIRLFKLWAWASKTESSLNSLQNLLYFRSKGKIKTQFFIKELCAEHQGWFTNDDVVMVINTHYEDSGEDNPVMIVRGKTKPDGSEYTLREQIIDAMNDLEFETESGEIHKGPIAQISPAHFSEESDELSERIRELVDAKMLLTDVKDFDLSMPSYIMDYWSVAQKKFLRPAHPAAGSGRGTVKVTNRKTKGKGSEKIATMEIGGREIQFNLSTGEAKIGSGKWFSPITSTKSIDAEIKKLGFKDARDFVRTARAIAIIADKYGNSTTGDGRIGDRVLLKDFTKNKDEGFVITDNGGRFMTADELAKFKNELKSEKSKKTTRKKSAEAERVNEARKEIEKGQEGAKDEEPDNEDEFEQEADSNFRSRQREVEKMKKIHTVRQAIEHLKKHAPQYSEFLDKISGISFYDDVLVELADLTGAKSSRGGSTIGTNKFRFNEAQSIFTDSIVIGKDSLGYQTLMHEIVHAFTVVALRYDRNLYEDIKSEMNYLQDSIGNKRLSRVLGAYESAYAFENPFEFIAEFFSNPKLQKLAKEVKTPEEIDNKKPSVFARIVSFIANKLKSLFKKKTGSYYTDLKDKLMSVVDRQVELQETGKVTFKTGEEFEKAKRIASGASVDGVAMSTKIPTVEENYNYAYDWTLFNDGNLVPTKGRFTGPGKYLSLSQLVAANDRYSSLIGMRRFVNSNNLYEYNSGTESSLFGVRDENSGVFVVVRALPAGGSDYSALIRTASESEVPMIIGSTSDNVDFYKAFGFHPVHSGSVDGKVFMANKSFTDADLYKLGTTYRPFADVLDSNDEFTRLRREAYSDQDWNKFSEMEKYHARKCIGI